MFLIAQKFVESIEVNSRWGSNANLAETRTKAIISVYSHEVCVYCSDL